MEYETLNISRFNKTITIILNRPEVHNAMNEKLMLELTHIFNELSNDESIRCIVLTGNGKSFCAGADLNWMKSMVNFSKQQNIRDSTLLLDLFNAIYDCPKPVIGKINGHAFGGGIGLIAVCDITISIPGLKFAFSEANLGIIPSVISTFVRPRINSATMRRLFITAERFDSEVAHKIGLIDIVVPEDEFDSKIDFYIKMIKSSGPNAISEVKNLIKKLAEMDTNTFKKYSVEKISELRVSKEGQDGINAFLSKSKPKWRE